MSTLLIGEKERRHIARAKATAARHPTTLKASMDMQFANPDVTSPKMLKDRPANYDPSRMGPVVEVKIPVGYVAKYSVEEQPPGLCAHLSIGVEGRKKKGMMPSEEAVKMIAEEFGIPFPPNAKMWVEEYEPGEFAINLVHLLHEPKGGSA